MLKLFGGVAERWLADNLVNHSNGFTSQLPFPKKKRDEDLGLVNLEAVDSMRRPIPVDSAGLRGHERGKSNRHAQRPKIVVNVCLQVCLGPASAS